MKTSKLRHSNRGELPLIPLRNMVVLPYNVTPFYVEDASSLRALNAAVSLDREIFLVFQKTDNTNLSLKNIHSVGTVSRIVQVLKLSDGNMRVLVEGRYRAKLNRFHQKKDITWGSYSLLSETTKLESRTIALMQAVKDDFLEYTKISPQKPSEEIAVAINKSNNSEKLVGHVCGALKINPTQKILFLLEKDNQRRLEKLSIALRLETENFKIDNEIKNRVKKRLDRSRKEFFLNEQIKEIRKELDHEDSNPSEAEDLRHKLKKLNLSDEIQEKLLGDIKRLSLLQPMSPESGVMRAYLEWITSLPWGQQTPEQTDIHEAAHILNSDHFGLDEPKERILDFIAVHQLQAKPRSPILCFVGPPGTGKTSLGKSVAKALARNFVRISLGGIRDEAEIRGHRKTYVGALPGKIIQSMKKAGSRNPVFLLDEIDKISNDYRGDPSSALLEVLDPEQNNSFMDHYLEVPFDLSNVLFITTANNLNNIASPLRDRMEIIRISGYTVWEKKCIARQFIIPRQVWENGLSNTEISFTEEALDLLIRGYTLESGVRNMERSISRVIRKLVRKFQYEEQTRAGRWVMNSAALHKNQSFFSVNLNPDRNIPDTKEMQIEISSSLLQKFLGKEQLEDDLGHQNHPGLALGLYYDGGGGGILPIEARFFDGEGKLILTGQLGDVMKESATIALSYLKAHKDRFGLKANFEKNKDIHIHVPQGAIPVDGPSAGIALTAALLSTIKNIPLKKGIVMTGEVTLTGRILPVGGIREKTLAAGRRGFTSILMPAANKRDFDELPKEISGTMKILLHSVLEEALFALFPEESFPN